MKKFVFYFICYIGCLLVNFNSAAAQDVPLSQEKEKTLVNITLPVRQTTEDEMITQTTKDSAPVDTIISTINNTEKENSPLETASQPPAPKKRMDVLKKIVADFYKFALIPYVIDKMYPDAEIKKDITGVLAQFYPDVDREKLVSLGKYIKYFVSAKRRYNYVIQRLEQRIKANKIIPQDAPIVAEEGEYASAYSDERKQSKSGEYQIKYQPYKYIEYDAGELGEPVRRRDKNYRGEAPNVDDIILAILKFDIRGFVKALQKLPDATDGSDEIPNKLDNGVQARLLLALSSPGDNEKIRGAIDVYIPKGYYINGDFLNPNVRPQFFLSEDKANELNIKEYQLFLPEANGVVKDGQAKRILTHIVRYPIEFTRRDITKPMKVKGTFAFVMCDKDSVCVPVKTEHELTLRPSEHEELSIYYNYITQGFTHLPDETSRHAKLNSAVFDSSKNTLTLKFNTSKSFSQAAVMVEDAVSTNFINPQYQISDNEVSVTLDATAPAVSTIGNGVDGGDGAFLSPPKEIAVTAMFGGRENLRTVVQPTIISSSAGIGALGSVSSPSLSLWTAFIFGLFLNLMPGIFYLFIRLTHLFWSREDRFKIFKRYALGAATGLALVGFIFHKHYWSIMIETPVLTALSSIIVVSFLCECLGFMDFALFRPLRGKLRRGFLIGLFTVTLATSFPMFLAPKVFSNVLPLPPFQIAKYFIAVWMGILALPLLTLLFPKPQSYFISSMRRLNILYNILYLLGILWIIMALRGDLCFELVFVCLGLIGGLWYIYPTAINKAIKGIRSSKKQQQKFYQVQVRTFIILIILSIFTYAAIASFPVTETSKQYSTPHEIISKAEQTDAPILVTVSSPWSLAYLYNMIFTKKLTHYNIQTFRIEILGEAETAMPWFAFYNQQYGPINVLFNARHPRGLKLPENIKNIDWEKALELFEKPSTSDEGTPQND